MKRFSELYHRINQDAADGSTPYPINLAQAYQRARTCLKIVQPRIADGSGKAFGSMALVSDDIDNSGKGFGSGKASGKRFGKTSGKGTGSVKGKGKDGNKSKSAAETKGPCHNCGKMGHFKAQCPDNKRDDGGKQLTKADKNGKRGAKSSNLIQWCGDDATMPGDFSPFCFMMHLQPGDTDSDTNSDSLPELILGAVAIPDDGDGDDIEDEAGADVQVQFADMQDHSFDMHEYVELSGDDLAAYAGLEPTVSLEDGSYVYGNHDYIDDVMMRSGVASDHYSAIVGASLGPTSSGANPVNIESSDRSTSSTQVNNVDMASSSTVSRTSCIHYMTHNDNVSFNTRRRNEAPILFNDCIVSSSCESAGEISGEISSGESKPRDADDDDVDVDADADNDGHVTSSVIVPPMTNVESPMLNLSMQRATMARADYIHWCRPATVVKMIQQMEDEQLLLHRYHGTVNQFGAVHIPHGVMSYTDACIICDRVIVEMKMIPDTSLQYVAITTCTFKQYDRVLAAILRSTKNEYTYEIYSYEVPQRSSCVCRWCTLCRDDERCMSPRRTIHYITDLPEADSVRADTYIDLGDNFDPDGDDKEEHSSSSSTSSNRRSAPSNSRSRAVRARPSCSLQNMSGGGRAGTSRAIRQPTASPTTPPVSQPTANPTIPERNEELRENLLNFFPPPLPYTAPTSEVRSAVQDPIPGQELDHLMSLAASRFQVWSELARVRHAIQEHRHALFMRLANVLDLPGPPRRLPVNRDMRAQVDRVISYLQAGAVFQPRLATTRVEATPCCQILPTASQRPTYRLLGPESSDSDANESYQS